MNNKIDREKFLAKHKSACSSHGEHVVTDGCCGEHVVADICCGEHLVDAHSSCGCSRCENIGVDITSSGERVVDTHSSCGERVVDTHSSCGCSRCENIGVDITSSGERAKVNHAEFSIKIACMAASLTLLLCGIFIKLPKYVNLALFLPSLLLVGGEYLWLAVKNLAKGKIFDENFLMSIAAIGAFAIGQYPEGVAVMLLYSIGEMLQDFAVNRSKRNIADMLNLKTPFANKLDGGITTKVSTDAINIGDILIVASGEKIPVDGVVLSGDSYIDSSMLTGEFKPKHVVANDEILGGAILQGGSITIRANKLYKDTTCAKILELVQNSQEKKPKTEQFISKFAKYYTPIVVLIALVIAFIPPLILGFAANIQAYVHKALIFLVISCPCALVISVPLGFFAGIGGASRRGVLFKGGNYMEALKVVDTIVFDKTGTLTEGVFEVTKIAPQGVEDNVLLELCAYAESRSNHPIATSIIKAYGHPIDSARISDYQEISGRGISLIYEGKSLVCGSEKFLNERGIAVSERPDKGGTIIYIALGGDFLGYIVINDKIKTSSQKVIDYLHSIHKKIVLMSGDNEGAVSAVANALGIEEYHHSLLPTGKAALLTQLQDSGHKVAFVGDGLNDAPVLKLASVGICVSGISNDASVEASDIVLANSDIKGVITAFKAAKKTRSVVMFNIVLALLTKLIIMILGLSVAPSMWLALVADVGVSLIAILNSARAMRIKE